MVKRPRKAPVFDDETSSEDEEHESKKRSHILKVRKPEKDSNCENKGSPNSPKDSDTEKGDYLSLSIPDNSNSGTNQASPLKSGKASLDTSIADRLPKGLRMMEMMGYKIGESLGKADNGAKNISLPIKPMVKNNKEGIKSLQKTLWGMHNNEEGTEPGNFREWQHNLKDVERKERVFQSMEKIAFEMTGDIDHFSEKSDPRDFNVLWRRYVIDLLTRLHRNSNITKEEVKPILSEDNDEEDQLIVLNREDFELQAFEDMHIDQKIASINNFLRTELRYCFYCGCKYKDDEDLFAHCPGDQEEDHM